MELFIIGIHYASAFSLSLGIVLFARYFFSSTHFSLAERKKKVYLHVFGSFCIAALSEAISCYFAGRTDNFCITAALAVVLFLICLCFFIKRIKRKPAEQKESHNP